MYRQKCSGISDWFSQAIVGSFLCGGGAGLIRLIAQASVFTVQCAVKYVMCSVQFVLCGVYGFIVHFSPCSE